MNQNLVYEIETNYPPNNSKCYLKGNNFHQNANMFSSDCIWSACKALMFGCFLMIVGAIMATIGYYSDNVPENSDKNDNRQFHLSNLSYAGAFIMGVGGFIILAACVITFEACDSTPAKVIPSRFRTYQQPHLDGSFTYRQAKSNQTDRKALKTAFMQFSENLGSLERKNSNKPLLKEKILRSPSAPDLSKNPSLKNLINLTNQQILPTDYSSTPKRKRFQNYNRQAVSVDETAGMYLRQSHDSINGSQRSSLVTMDTQPIDNSLGFISVQIHENRSKRKPLIRQKPIIIEDEHSSHRRTSHTSDSTVIIHRGKLSPNQKQPKNFSLDY